MSGSVNKVILVGNVGRDPETRRMTSGEAVVSFSVATSETWRDKASGERKERTEWHNVVIFNENLGKVAEQYIKKGSKVYLEGQLQTRKYTDKNGAERQSTEVVLQRFRGELTLLDSRNSGGGSRDEMGGPEERGSVSYGGTGGGYGGGGGGGGASRPPPASSGRLSGDLDDDIPF